MDIIQENDLLKHIRSLETRAHFILQRPANFLNLVGKDDQSYGMFGLLRPILSEHKLDIMLFEAANLIVGLKHLMHPLEFIIRRAGWDVTWHWPDSEPQFRQAAA